MQQSHSTWLCVSVVLLLTAGCSSDSLPGVPRIDGGGPGDDDGSVPIVDGGRDGSIPRRDGGGGSGDGGESLTLTIEPAEVDLVGTGVPVTQTFVGRLSDGSTPEGVQWLLDDATLGTINASGVFTARGTVSGEVTIRAAYGNQVATAKITVTVAIVDNRGSLPQQDIDRLRDGGTFDNQFRFLYPYDGTVFPRGIPGPVMQFGGSGATAMRVLLETEGYSYEGFFGSSNPARASLPGDVFQRLALSAKPGAPVTVSVTKANGTSITGPATQTWRIAPGSLKGLVYYKSYSSPLANNAGAILRIRPGEGAEVFASNQGCTVCHSISANGARMIAASGWDVFAVRPTSSGSYALQNDGSIASLATSTQGNRFPFGALTPDGSRFVSNGVPAIFSGTPTLRGMYDFNGIPSKVYDTATGNEVSAPSLASQVTMAITPAFSPDGTRLAYNNGDTGHGRTLSILNANLSANPPSFSGASELLTHGTRMLAWPSFLPSGEALVYHEGTHLDTAVDTFTDEQGPAHAKIRLIDIATRTVKQLAALNGDTASGTYLPYGDAEEGDMNYEPTVVPVPVGGYYWVIFTSRRAYGNTIAPGGTQAGGDAIFRKNSPRKKLWVAAIDLDYATKDDPSHPAFYLPGQELAAGNMRAFAALEPCKPNGSSCESGVDCCGGYCRQTSTNSAGEPVLQCVPPQEIECANEDERCTTAADCCDVTEGYQCINGRCAQPVPIVI